MTRGAETILSALRRFLLTGLGQVHNIAAGLARQCQDRRGIGIAVYSSGKQLACRVSLDAPTVPSIVKLLTLIRSELPANTVDAIVLLAKLDQPRTISIDEYWARGIRIGFETIAAVHNQRVTLILSHVPCFMSWSSRQLGEALIFKQGGARPLELHVFPTENIWIDDDGAQPTCRGGLSKRMACLDTAAGLLFEIKLVAGYMHGQISKTDSIQNAYDPWRNRILSAVSVGQQAITIAAYIRAARVLDKVGDAQRGVAMLARLAKQRNPTGDIHDAHLLLTSPAGSAKRLIDRVRSRLCNSGAIIAPCNDEQDFFPGVALAALATHRALSDMEYLRSLHYYRQRFRERPTWPAAWWQLRAWSTIAQISDCKATDFVFELADWALARQTTSGAFDTSSWPVGPSFQTVCVVEGLLGAVRAARQFGCRSHMQWYLAAARRGLHFSSSLVLDERRAKILPDPPQAVGGVRTWHGEMILRADVAGHYLAALTDFFELVQDE